MRLRARAAGDLTKQPGWNYRPFQHMAYTVNVLIDREREGWRDGEGGIKSERGTSERRRGLAGRSLVYLNTDCYKEGQAVYVLHFMLTDWDTKWPLLFFSGPQMPVDN